MSKPANGDFACETFFYTMNDWKSHLRFTRFKKFDSLILMSDGLTNFAFDSDYKNINENFITPIDVFLNETKTKQKAIEALNQTFTNPKAERINPDDKTFLWAKIVK